MLCELSVQNLALIEDVRVELQPGFCAWSGETGAGKTLLLEAVGLLAGERGSTELLRAGAEELRVTGRFELTRPEQRRDVAQILGTVPEDEQLILTRRLTQTGRSYAYVNDQPVAISTLRQLGGVLVDIHGQRESQSLLEPAYQLQLLDAFGNLQSLRQAYGERAEELRALRRRHGALSTERQQRQRELALLRFEREELDAASILVGELAQLAAERERLAHAQSLQEFAANSYGRLYEEEGSVSEQLGRLLKETQAWIALDSDLADVAGRLEGQLCEVQDLARTLRDLGGRWEADPGRLDEVEKRLQVLRRLETKYGRPTDELPAYRASLEEQESRLLQQEEDLGTITVSLDKAFQRLKEAAKELSEQRRRVARRLTAAVRGHLADLGMAQAQLDAVLEPVPLPRDPLTGDIPSDGAEQLELMLAANRGEPARPLRKVASGGELSRAMLALKTVLAAHDQVATLIFDEIDANVGGRLGDVLGQKLAALGRTHQVICVTHLPQVASYARHHWTIRKRRRGTRTTTTIQWLNESERLEELASMLRGEARGDTTRREAAAMLAAARPSW
jgi:DNA repair protein RecN (Recombination protein N)